MSIKSPVVFLSKEDKGFPNNLSRLIRDNNSADKAKLLLSYPTVYIHFWPGTPCQYVDKNGDLVLKKQFYIYVGETYDVVERTKKHYADGQDKENWQYQLTHCSNPPHCFIIGHPHFNRSFTLDVENQLIEYLLPGDNKVINARSNPQNEYYPVEEFEKVFNSIWEQLRKHNNTLFRPLSEIEQSAFFKASPLKKLTNDQLLAKETILAKVADALNRGLEGQLIFVQGEAGTGKTVLNSALFYEMITKGKDLLGRTIDCHLMVNHDQQLSVYEQIAHRLDLGDDVVHKPTSFINKYSRKKKVDIAFIDEGHLLLTRGKQSYTGHNQLEDIIQRARVTVLMFDEYQVLTAEEYWEPEVLDKFKDLSHNQRNYLGLSQQLRMKCSPSTIQWINDFVLNRRVTRFVKDPDYIVKSFNSPKELEKEIKRRALSDPLSRIVASYDWPYNKDKRPSKRKYWDVRIDGWSKPWNYETLADLSERERRAIKKQSWAEQAHTIDEVGSTFTIQGFDLSYVGVILGPSVKYVNNEIVFSPSDSFNMKAKQKRTLNDGTKKSFGETFIRNEVKVLLTRGVKGLFIYACDKELRKALKNIADI